jgi:hypothetical protein
MLALGVIESLGRMLWDRLEAQINVYICRCTHPYENDVGMRCGLGGLVSFDDGLPKNVLWSSRLPWPSGVPANDMY